MSEEIVLWKLKDLNNDQEMDIRTAFIEREIQVVQQSKVPLYVDGVLVDDAKLAELNLERVGYTQTQIDTAHYAAMYAANPDLETRVREYKGLLDGLSLGYDSSIDDINAAIQTSETITDKTAYALQCKAIYDAIVTNMEFLGSDTPHMDTYIELAKLIQYLPAEA
ncbi:MAG: hypothetical protein KAS17_07690 [Victivallaceae bacterium]|nr:hypothetical protein [Victivallaceae bacterium]